MIKAESKGGERTLRSASPHRNAYKSDFHAIKCSFDGPKSDGSTKSYANGASDTREDSRGRPFGNRVNKIKNIFLQMDGQQQEAQEGKVTVKAEVTQVSPTKVQFPVNTQRANFTSPSSPESPNLDKTPKGEDVEIDKVALAEKFSVTRKLFERGIKEQPSAEKQSPNRVVNRLSLGSASDEGKSTRRVSGSSETIVKTDQAPRSTAESQVDGSTEGDKKHVARVSLNAGPISKRLENYMAENDSENVNKAPVKGGIVAAKQHSSTEPLLPTSTTRDSSHKSSAPVKEATNSTPVTDATKKSTSPTCVKPATLGSSLGPKPTFPATNAAYKSVSPTSDAIRKPLSPEQTTPVSHGYKRSSSSSDGFNRTSVGRDDDKSQRDAKQPPASAGVFQNRAEKARINDGMVQSPTREKPPSQTSSLNSRGVGMVRAELVVVKNESSESDEEENVEDNVFEEKAVQSSKDVPADSKRTFLTEKQNCNPAHQVLARDAARETQRIAETLGEGRVLEDNNQFVKEKSLFVNQDVDANHEEDDEAGEEESEPDEQVDENILDRVSPVVYGIENAAFVDDRDVEQVLREEDEEEEEEGDEEEDGVYREYEDCYEAPGLSDEEELPPKRKIKFSTQPIQVSTLCYCLHPNYSGSSEALKTFCTAVTLKTAISLTQQLSNPGGSQQTHRKFVVAEN